MEKIYRLIRNIRYRVFGVKPNVRVTEKVYTYKGDEESGLIFVPWIWVQCVDKNGKHLNGQLWMHSDDVKKLCKQDEEGNYVYVVPDEEINDKDYPPIKCTPSGYKNVKGRYLTFRVKDEESPCISSPDKFK